MTVAATSRYSTASTNDPMSLQLSEEEKGKLQEIHELINLMFRELSVSPQSVAQAQPYFTSKLPITPYTHGYFPWGVSPYLTSLGYQQVIPQGTLL